VGFAVDYAPNTVIAFERFKTRCPDVILLSLPLRGKATPDAIKSFRKDAEFGDNPIYIYSLDQSLDRPTRKALKEEGIKNFDKYSTTPQKLIAKIAKDMRSSDVHPEHLTAAALAKVEMEWSRQTHAELSEAIS